MVLPFYTSVEEQHHRLPYAYGNAYPLLCEQSSLPPFQLISNSANVQSYVIKLFSKNDEYVLSLSTLIDVEIVEVDGRSILVYKGGVLGTTVPIGTYYIGIKFGNEIYYSELFTTVGSTEGLLKLEWYDDETFVDRHNLIYYDNEYKNYIFIKSDIGKPEYTFEEDGEERDGIFFPARQLATKTYRFSFFAPEYLCDALRLLRMSDHVIVRDQYGNMYNVDSILVTPEWLDAGDIANVAIEFTSNSVVKKLGMGYLRTKLADFNTDFTGTDFSNN